MVFLRKLTDSFLLIFRIQTIKACFIRRLATNWRGISVPESSDKSEFLRKETGPRIVDSVALLGSVMSRLLVVFDLDQDLSPYFF